MFRLCWALRLGNAVASSGTRATAPPSVKIGMVENGEVIFSDCRMRTIDHLVRQRRQRAGLPVVTAPMRQRRVEHRLVRCVRLSARIASRAGDLKFRSSSNSLLPSSMAPA